MPKPKPSPKPSRYLVQTLVPSLQTQTQTRYLVQTDMFDDSLWLGYADAPPGAFFMDDVWVSGRLAHARVKRFVVRV